MNTLLQIEIYTFQHKQMRVLGTYEEPWFAVKDICNILGISNVTMALKNIPEKWKGVKKFLTPSGEQEMLVVNEAGFYKLIIRSTKPEAQPFQEWACEEVFPSIRKKGEYILEEYKAKLEAQQKLLEKSKEILDEKESELEKQTKLTEEQAKALYDKNQLIKSLQREKQVVKGEKIVYLATADTAEEKGIYTIGKAKDINSRLDDYNANKLFNFKMVKYISCKSFTLMTAIEKIMLSKFNRYKCLSNRDVFKLPVGKDVTFFTQWYDYIEKFCEDIEDNIKLEEETFEEQKRLEKEKQKTRYQEIKDEQNKKVQCECGAIVSNHHLARHKTTGKHITTMKSKERVELEKRTKENQIVVEVVPVMTRVCDLCKVEKPLDEKNFTSIVYSFVSCDNKNKKKINNIV